MSSPLVKVLGLAGICLLMTACNPILRTHGYIPTEEKPQAVEPESDTKASVLARLGNPSTKGTFDESLDQDTWYYLTSVRQRVAYLRAKRLLEAANFQRLSRFSEPLADCLPNN